MNYDCIIGELKDRLLLLCRTVALYLTRLKFILMKKLFVFFMALLLPLFALKMSADDENAIIKIPLEAQQKTKLNRSLIDEPITCHYYGMMTSIVTTISTNQGNISLTITNLSTGEVWYETVNSATTTQAILPISGSMGLYEIVYTTESGDIYEGSLTIY